MIERPLYLERLEAWKDTDMIKVVTGIRRCGKSSLLMSFADRLRKRGVSESCIIQINLEELTYEEMDYKTLHNLLLKKAEENKGKKTYIFLDEVQKVLSWEKMAASLRLHENIDLYVTGSNAYILSSELATFLSGRYIEIKMLPLSFKEFLSFNTFPQETSVNQKLQVYLNMGGMPALANCNFDEKKISEVLEGLSNTVLIKDILTRCDTKDVQTVQKVLAFLTDNIASRTSTNKIANTLYSENQISSRNYRLIENLIGLFEKAFIFYKVPRYDLKGKDLLRSLEKYYIADVGLRKHILGRTSDSGRILENIVYLELLRRKYTVTTGKYDTQEIDFIAYNDKEKLYIQVCESLADPETRKRELRLLNSIQDSFKKIILTPDTLLHQVTDEGIHIINLTDWLLS